MTTTEHDADDHFHCPTCQQELPLTRKPSVGSICQGMPVLRTKTMPARAARFGTGGRPPLGLAGSLGSSGSMASQRSSGTSASWFIGRIMPRPAGFETSS